MADIRFGVATRDITPPWPVMLHGYGARDRLCGTRGEDRVAEPISARVLALEGSDGHGGRKRILVVCLDTIGVQAGEAGMLRGKIARATGLTASDVMIAATHTHFAPSISTGLFSPPAFGIVDPDPRYVAMVTRAVVEAASQGFADLEEGVLEDYRVQVPSVVFNRRTITRASGAAKRVETNFLFPENPQLYEFSPVDPELATLRIRTVRGPGVALLNFGCHPVTGGEGADRGYYRISADYPHYVRTCVEEAWKCPALFTLGAAGDAVPMNRGGGSRQQIGEALGNAALLGERQFLASSRREVGAAVVASHTVKMEVKTIIPAASPDAERAYTESREKLIALGGRDPADPALQDAVRIFRENGIRAYRARLYPADRAILEMHLLRIGRTVLVGLPFEVLSEMSLRLKRAFPGTVLVSTANGYEGYLPFAFEYERGGYEASAESTHFEIGTADRILDRLLEELRTF